MQRMALKGVKTGFMVPKTTYFRNLGEIVSPEHTAIVVIDMQNDFCSPGGFFDKRSDLTLVREMMPRLEKFLSACRELGLKIVHLAMYIDPQRTTSPMCERWDRLGINEDYCMEGAWGGNFCDNLTPQPGEHVFPKYCYSGLTSQDFRAWLESTNTRTLVLTGVATNICVESTAREAYMSGYYAVMVEDCVAAYSPEEQRMALQNTKRYFGNVASSAELLRIWQQE